MSGPIMKGAADLCSRVNTPAERRGSSIGGTGSGTITCTLSATAAIRARSSVVMPDGSPFPATLDWPQTTKTDGRSVRARAIPIETGADVWQTEREGVVPRKLVTQPLTHAMKTKQLCAHILYRTVAAPREECSDARICAVCLPLRCLRLLGLLPYGWPRCSLARAACRPTTLRAKGRGARLW